MPNPIGGIINKLHALTLALLSAAIALPVHAQPSPPDSLGDFTMERVLTLQGISSQAPPNLPQLVLNSLQTGAIEVHQIFVYNSAQRTLEQTSYVVPGHSSLPFPNLSAAPLNDHYIIQVDSVGLSQAHGPSAALVGHVISNDVPTPFGDIAGTEITLSFGYRGSGASTQFTQIMEAVPPVYSIYTASGVGSLSPTATPQKCTVASLKGAYLYTLRGAVETSPNNWATYVESGRFIADGSGTMAISGTAHIGESISPNRQTATYVVNEDCTGTLSGSSGFKMDITLSNDGQRVNLVFTSPSVVAAMGDGRLQ